MVAVSILNPCPKKESKLPVFPFLCLGYYSGFSKRFYLSSTFPTHMNVFMKVPTRRTVLRTVHIIFSLPLIGYIYGPPAETVQYLPFFRYGYFPMVAISGLLMWKGHLLLRGTAKTND